MPHTLPKFVCAMFLLLKHIVSAAFVSTAAATAGWDRCHRSLDCQSLPLAGFSFHPRHLPPLAGLCCHVLLDCQSLQLTEFSFRPRESIPLTGGVESSYHNTFLYIDCVSSVHGPPLQSSPLRDQSLTRRWPFPSWPRPPPLAFPSDLMAKGRDDNYTTLSTERMRVRSCIYLRN